MHQAVVLTCLEQTGTQSYFQALLCSISHSLNLEATDRALSFKYRLNYGQTGALSVIHRLVNPLEFTSRAPVMLALSNLEFMLRHAELGKIYFNGRKAQRLCGSW